MKCICDSCPQHRHWALCLHKTCLFIQKDNLAIYFKLDSYQNVIIYYKEILLIFFCEMTDDTHSTALKPGNSL